MENKQTNSTIKSRAAVAFAPNQPLQIVEIDVEMPRKGEVLIRNTHTGVCHTDAFTLSGSDPEGVFPVVLGHEGAGVVVAVGEGVSSVKPGDHVIPLYTAECGECEFCRSGKTNLCVAVRETQGKGLNAGRHDAFFLIKVSRSITIWAVRLSVNTQLLPKFHWRKSTPKPTTNKYVCSAAALPQVLVRYIIRQKCKKATLLPCLAWERLVWLWCKVRVKPKRPHYRH